MHPTAGRKAERGAHSAPFLWFANGAVHASLPPPEMALDEPNGLLALGGDLAPDTLLDAYARGVFPWFNQNEAILWWAPDPRCVLEPSAVRVSRSLRRRLERHEFRVTADRHFTAVVRGCAAPRRASAGTWITASMEVAYNRLHALGLAHSIEVLQDGELVGGLYGVGLGRMFFGESMFHRRTDASKVALVTLCRQLQRWGFMLIDCQVASEHLYRMGAVDIPRAEFLRLLAHATDTPSLTGSWTLDDDL